jgi:hypothetical protein
MLYILEIRFRQKESIYENSALELMAESLLCLHHPLTGAFLLAGFLR